MLPNLFRKLLITSISKLPSGLTLVRINRWNPLTWVLFVILLSASPIICILTTLSIFDIFRELWNIIRGKAE